MIRRLLLPAVAIIAAVLVVATGVVFWPALTCGGSDCPTVENLRAYQPPQASRVFAEDGSVLADLSPQRRVVVDLSEMSPILRAGAVAVEDRRFQDHHGVDLKSVGRAAVRNVRELSLREGFSTIHMQLARSVFPGALPLSERVPRKLREMVLAVRMDRELDKERILELYLNQIYLGSGLYGMEAAAAGYFGTSAAEVSAAEAALLIALIKTPERYNPRRDPEAALARRNLVIDIMSEQGVLDVAEAEEARAAPLTLAPPFESAGSAPYALMGVRRELRDVIGLDAPTRGLRVYTSIEPEIQAAAREALLAQIKRIEDGVYGAYEHDRPEGELGVANGSGSPYLQGMIVVLDPHSGAVRALVGGRDFTHSQYDRALHAHRQPGSAFKPIVYAAAIERGLPASSMVSTSSVTVDDDASPPWRPGDHVADSVGSITTREALALSSNHAAVRVGQWVGTDGVAEVAHSLGISTPIPPYPSMYLGAAEVVPAELVAAYAAFGNGGYRVEPHFITRIEDTDGEVLWRPPATRQRALERGVAYIGLDMLRDVVDRGTGGAVRRAGFQLAAAGKTGTTNGSRDAWFVGLTPDLVAGVWLGFDQPRTILAGGSGGGLAAPAWADLMNRIYRTRAAPGDWSPPHDVIPMEIDRESGLVATRECPHEQVYTEYYLPGTTPSEYCPIHSERRFFGRIWDRIRHTF